MVYPVVSTQLSVNLFIYFPPLINKYNGGLSESILYQLTIG